MHGNRLATNPLFIGRCVQDTGFFMTLYQPDFLFCLASCLLENVPIRYWHPNKFFGQWCLLILDFWKKIDWWMGGRGNCNGHHPSYLNKYYEKHLIKNSHSIRNKWHRINNQWILVKNCQTSWKFTKKNEEKFKIIKILL